MKRKLAELCTGYTKNIALKDLEDREGAFPVYGASGFIKNIDYYVSDVPYIAIVKDGAGAGRVFICPEKSSLLGTMQYIVPRDDVDIRYLSYALQNLKLGTTFQGSTIPHIYFKDYKENEISFVPYDEQVKKASKLEQIEKAIALSNRQLSLLDEVIKSRFIEMFGDLKTNPKGWPEKQFPEFAEIDGNMTTDYEKYADSPHIGIDSIEKGTGELRGYRTVREDGVISGKYIFSPEHIIYSKIRPNLNKVALPHFSGLCSADAYPILPHKDVCNRIYLATVMRSDFFLDYILQFSSRANMPKVNRKEISGFVMPMPPLWLQNEFASFVEQIDKSKLVIKKSLGELEELKDSLMQKYFFD